jgi:hypothetical protein
MLEPESLRELIKAENVCLFSEILASFAENSEEINLSFRPGQVDKARPCKKKNRESS